MMSRLLGFSLVLSFACSLAAAGLELPKPAKTGGMPLMDALKNRKSSREFSDKKLSPQTLSDLLWAAWGVNRGDGKRTAPSSMNMREISVYVAMAEGLYLFDPEKHQLDKVLDKDLREATGVQPFTKVAPVDLIFVADLDKMAAIKEPETKVFFSAVDTGYISQNVYLFCASEKLATVVLGWVNKPELKKAMGLRPTQEVILTQPVGYPK